MLYNFANILVFIIFGALFVGINILLSRLIQTRNPTPVKLSTYECGELPEGNSWVQFNIRFYVIALIFLIFEVEILFLFPWAVVYKDLSEKFGAFAFIEMMVFVFILLVGLAYVWAKGDLEWDKPKIVPSTELSPRQEQTEPVHETVS